MKLQSFGIMMLVLIGVLLLSISFVRAETIVLKSGKTVQGKLIEITDKYMKIDFQGVPLTYFFDEIESVDGNKIEKQGNRLVMANPELAKIKTLCSAALQNDVLRTISYLMGAEEKVDKGVKPEIISQQVIFVESTRDPPGYKQFAEKWVVRMGEKEKAYFMKCVSSSIGGTDFSVESFDNFEKKMRKVD